MLQKKGIRIVLAALLAAVVVIGGFFAYRYVILRLANTHTLNIAAGQWFYIRPEGIVSANGTPVASCMKLGEESDKLIVLFYGGGISVDEYTASHPFTTTDFINEDGLYAPDISGMIPDLISSGLGSSEDVNPFRDWSVVIIPYTTADYHIGTADYVYTDEDGNEQILHHHGYTNYRALMDRAVQYIDGPVSELLIAGTSAGGFGAVMLADEIIEDYFPEAAHVTLCVDSACQYYDRWAEVARDVWGAPEELVDVMESDNLVVDFMSRLYETYGDRMTYLYIGSVRDGSLAKYQSYLNGGRFYVNDRQGQFFSVGLKDMLEELREAVPGVGVYLFDFLPYSMKPNQLRLTQHTILVASPVFWNLTNRVRPADWLMDAVQGDVRVYGMQLLR